MKHIINSYNRHTERLEDINKYARECPDEFIANAEHQYRKSILDIVDVVCECDSCYKMLMLAGPSASGKTTTAKMIIEEVEKRGKHASLISLDNFFKGREQAPLLPNGKFDYESIEALNIGQMQKCLSDLIKQGYSDIPIFDFLKGAQNEQLERMTLKDDEIVIVEGIHALNPITCGALPQDKLLKIYVSVKQGVRINDKDDLLTYADIRLIRRIVRDRQFRNNSPEGTMNMWEQVIASEKVNIQPFKRSSDVVINSIHMYEPCVFGSMLIPLLETVPEDSEHKKELNRLHDALLEVVEIPIEKVPDSSLLREFLGKSRYYPE